MAGQRRQPAGGRIDRGGCGSDENALSPSLSVRSMMRVDGEARSGVGGSGTSDAAMTAT
jgi:hypothetical protein